MLRYYKNGQQICFCWSILCPSGGNLVCIRRYCLYIRRKLLYDTKQQGRYIHKTIIFFSAENPSLRHPLSFKHSQISLWGMAFFRTSFCSLSVSAIIQPWTEKTVHTHFVLALRFKSSVAFGICRGWLLLCLERNRLLKDRREQKCFCHIKNKPLFILRQYHILHIIISSERSTKK